MKTLPPAFAAHLATGATTLCHCWRLVRADGQVQGFTDHDADLSFDGQTYAAATGLATSAQETTAGLSVDNATVIGALNAASLTEADLSAGLYDNAEIEIHRVNWADVEQRYLVRKGTIGEVTRGETGFTAELRGLAHHLDQTVGRVYQHNCDADLGDARCTVDLEAAALKGSGAVASAADARSFIATGLDAFASDWFSRGKVVWTTGANAGCAADVKRHVKTATSVSVELWLPMSEAMGPSDAFTITAGCDKQSITCKNKFSNLVNFRGFHLMPGNDFVQSYPNRGENNDGGKRS